MVNKRESVVFILGAGFSRNAGAPLIRDFLDHSRQLYEDPTVDLTDFERDQFQIAFEFKRKMAQAREKIAIDLDNIEKLFGLVDISERLHSSPTETRNAIVYLIARTIYGCVSRNNHTAQIGFQLPLEYDTVQMPDGWRREDRGQRMHLAPIYDFFAALITGKLDHPDKSKIRKNTVITFNYDLVLDSALRRIGAEPDYGFSRVSDHSDEDISIIKLHGSMNWAICPACKTVSILPATSDLAPLQIMSNACRECSASTQLLLIPPSWDKSEYRGVLYPVWTRAIEELTSATHICIIGYSMPETDAFFEALLTLGLFDNHQLRSLIVVDISGTIDQKYKVLLENFFP